MVTVAGSIISLHVVLGSITRLFTRYMYGFISAFHHWNRKQRIPTDSSTEVAFWRKHVQSLDRRQLRQPSCPIPIEVQVGFDTSSSACGELHVSHKNLLVNEKAKSSTWRGGASRLRKLHTPVTRKIRCLADR